jgi:hypothetical protein
MHVCMNAYMHACIYVCVRACVCVRAVFTHTHCTWVSTIRGGPWNITPENKKEKSIFFLVKKE